MKTFLLFIAAIIALGILLINIGPLIMFVVGGFLLYIIFKKFVKAQSTGAKVMWVVLGLIVLSMTISNVFGLIGLVALYVLYQLFKKEKAPDHSANHDDPFTNFENQWANITKS
ncbi:lmo0954 family membrane protein [Salipaludibacillus agaradhaerens]|uniref:lmo0954 family membrane protein n=1 Tax=Salipaludibacillus agaradhaerens TaxID=76935 RepID=UPI000997C542|nr:flagellar basal body rod protein [Salipaludibacillus agaradhaerens]